MSNLYLKLYSILYIYGILLSIYCELHDHKRQSIDNIVSLPQGETGKESRRIRMLSG